MIGYRHCGPRSPFLWEDAAQPSARWHRRGEGPAHYFADTPDGAWAEFLRHEEIVDPADLAGVRRAIWAVDLGEPPPGPPDLPVEVLTGGLDSYPACQEEADRLRAGGATGFSTASAALAPGEAAGWVIDGGVHRTPERDGTVVVLFGRRPDLEGWQISDDARPPQRLLAHVHHL